MDGVRMGLDQQRRHLLSHQNRTPGKHGLRLFLVPGGDAFAQNPLPISWGSVFSFPAGQCACQRETCSSGAGPGLARGEPSMSIWYKRGCARGAAEERARGRWACLVCPRLPMRVNPYQPLFGGSHAQPLVAALTCGVPWRAAVATTAFPADPQTSLLLILTSRAHKVGRDSMPDLGVQQTRTRARPRHCHACYHCSVPQFPYLGKRGVVIPAPLG